MALNDVECCDFYQVHEDVVKSVTDKMPDEDQLFLRCLAIPHGLRFCMYCLNQRCACAILPSF